MKAIEFIEIWRAFAAEKLTFLSEAQKELTRGILGEPKRQNTGSPLGDFLQSRFPSYEYHTEDGKVDISFTNQNSFDEIFSMHEFLQQRVNVAANGYPIGYSVLLEHEIDTATAYKEMVKLTYYNWCYAVVEPICRKRTLADIQNPVSGKSTETVRNISYYKSPLKVLIT